jgi:hypothetical protein
MADKQQATTPAKEHVIEEDDEFEEFENEGACAVAIACPDRIQLGGGRSSISYLMRWVFHLWPQNGRRIRRTLTMPSSGRTIGMMRR